ncbi:serine hydrolase domain-containing protein [Pelagimonas varians]|uniref:6-aminohexanoate-dimer hydrolase n=1 Tax=Pelagimonas varians TaxID=696760 RepID=A0A238L5C6_9RHOB|nr:serine hydrolase domain-containing protein [Pelagimonas varians]PYG25648.1 CubicO group peptidase (beta-lactamase class C family) [Pelagimonas varians]SMX50178.1 6-aminohexanoate-dimer hydrolase [Pelagimonas varians]
MHKEFWTSAFAVIATLLPFAASAQDHPLAQYLEVPGATTTLPVDTAKTPWSLQFSKEAQAAFENFHYQMGGDHALYYNQNLSEFLPTAYSSPHPIYMPLERAPKADIADAVVFPVNEGKLSLNEYIEHPNHRVQGIMMVHKGKVVFESFPGMNPMDRHVWMSPGKATVGLVMAMMEEEGKIDTSLPVSDYASELQGTLWDDVPMLDALNMSAGLALEETLESITDPASIIVRFFSAEFGAPNPMTGETENWLDILRDAEAIAGEKPGEVFRYSSAVTQVAVLAAERIDDMTWADLFETRIWGKVGARMDFQHQLMPDGTAVSHGLISTTLEDFARFGMLFTPSWHKTAHEQVVSDAVLKRLQTAGNVEAFRAGAKFAGLTEEFGEEPLMNSMQFDAIFEDGALYKHGNIGQGIYIDPARDFVGVYYSTNGYIPPYGEDKAMGFLRTAAKHFAGE